MSIDNKYAPADPRQRLAAAPARRRASTTWSSRSTRAPSRRPGDEGELDGPARLDPAAGEPGRDPRLARRRYPAFLKLLLANGAEALDPAQGRGREALQRAAPPGPVRARHLADQRRARDAPPEHRQLDPQLPAPLDRARQPRSGPGQLRGLLDAVLASFAKEQASIRSAVRELPGTLKVTKGALTSANAFALQSGPALKKPIPGAKATGAGAARAAALLPADGRPDRESDPALHHAGGEPRDQHVAQIGAGPRARRRPGLKTGFTDSTTASTPSPTTRPARARGLPLLRPLAQPRPERELHAAGRLRPDPPRPSCWRAAGTAQTAEQTLLAEPYLRLLYQLTGQPRAAKNPGM